MHHIRARQDSKHQHKGKGNTNRNLRHAPGHRGECASLERAPLFPASARLHLHGDEVPLVQASLVVVVLVVVIVVVVPPVVVVVGDDAVGERRVIRN